MVPLEGEEETRTGGCSALGLPCAGKPEADKETQLTPGMKREQF